MKKQILTSLLMLVGVLELCAQNNVITYTANSKLPETTRTGMGWAGLQINNFGATMLKHEFNSETQIGTVTFDKDITSVGECAFCECKEMTAVTLPESVTSLGKYAFTSCAKLESFTFPSHVTHVSDNTFDNCFALKKVNLPDSLKSIGYMAFSSCQSMTSIFIPEAVDSIGQMVFSGCNKLFHITVEAVTPPSCHIKGLGAPSTATLHVHCPSVSAYAEATGWKSYHIVGYAATIIVLSADEKKGIVGQQNMGSCDKKIYAIPADGYKFTAWSDGNTDNPRVLLEPQKGLTLTADFVSEHVHPIVDKPGMRMKVNTESDGNYEFDTRNIKSIEYHLVTE